MANHDFIIDLNVAFYAPDLFKVKALVRQPFVHVKDVRVILGGKQLVLVNICMAGEAYLIVVADKLFHILIGTRIDLIGMRIMAHPTGKFFGMLGGMHTFMKFFFYALKVVLGIMVITAMAVNALIDWLHPQLSRMGESFVIVGVTVNTLKTPVVGLIKSGRINDEVGVHPFLHLAFNPIVVVIIIFMTMAFKATLVFLQIFIYTLWFFFNRRLRRKGFKNENSQENDEYRAGKQ
jgi:hypothetical protein